MPLSPLTPRGGFRARYRRAGRSGWQGGGEVDLVEITQPVVDSLECALQLAVGPGLPPCLQG